MDLGFGGSDDVEFERLLTKSSHNRSDPIFTIKPSELNFTADCWATVDFVRQLNDTYNGHQIKSLFKTLSVRSESLSPVYGDFNTTLPSGRLPPGTYGSFYGYLSLLVRLSGFTSTTNALAQYCSKMNVSLPLQGIDFARNCSETLAFWNDTTCSGRYPGSERVKKLLVSAMSSNGTLLLDSDHWQFAIRSFILRFRKSCAVNDSAKLFLPPLAAQYRDAVRSCATEACKNLDFPGNADIAGQGVCSGLVARPVGSLSADYHEAVIAYGFVATISTLIVAIFCYYMITRNCRFANHELRERTKETAVLFSETSLWFGMMACVASIIYTFVMATTKYENTLCFLVAFLLTNAGILTTLLGFYGDPLPHVRERNAISLIPFLVSIGSSLWFVIQIFSTRSLDGPDQAHNADWYCYVSEDWLNRLGKIAWIPQTALFGLVALCTMFEDIASVLLPIGILGLVSTMWTDFALIVTIRNRASTAFGSAYKDKSFGYGQIIATGFAAQALATYIVTVIGESKGAIACVKYTHVP